jgi:Rrf2 family protein
MAANSKFAVAVHALSVLAVERDERHTSRRIADSVATNPVVIRRLLAQLARAGLVESAHGAKGGFRLAKAPSQVTLHDVYKAVEDCGSLFAQRENSNKDCPVARRMKSILEDVFARVDAKVAPELKRTTLQDIVGRIKA